MTDERAPNRVRALRRLGTIGLFWGTLLYLLIGGDRTVNLWINVASVLSLMIAARFCGVFRTERALGWLMEGAAWHVASVQVANLLIAVFGSPV